MVRKDHYVVIKSSNGESLKHPLKQWMRVSRLQPGVYGIVEVKSQTKIRKDPPDKFWLDWSDKELERPIVEIYYLENLLHCPILLSELHDDKEINDPYLLRGFQASTMPLKRSSFQRITEIVSSKRSIYERISASITVDTIEQIRNLENKYSNALPEVKETVSKRIERGPIAEKIKGLSGYKCQICDFIGESPYSFLKANGEYYIETHHVIPVAEEGAGVLGLSNLMTVCANHHRQLHYGNAVLVENDDEKFVFNVDGTVVVVDKFRIK